MVEFHLRRADPDDAVAIAEVHMSARREAMPWLPELHSDVEILDWIASLVLPQQVVWVADSDGIVAGYAAIDVPSLNDLYVHPGRQRQGVGGALLEKARTESPDELSLWTFQRNVKARGFYERRGFTAVEFGDGSGNEEGEPDVRYMWTAPSD